MPDGPSDSLARESEGLFPQLLHVAHRGDAEEAFVLPIEVGGVLVAHAIGRTGRVEVFAQHQTAGLLQPQPFLELQGAAHLEDFAESDKHFRQSFYHPVLQGVYNYHQTENMLLCFCR